MSKTKRRLQALKRSIRVRSYGIKLSWACPNCGDEGPHFVPPSFGEPGFYICSKKAGGEG